MASVVVAIEHILTDGGGNFAPWGFVWFHEVGWSRYDGDDRVSKGDRMTFTQVKFASFETYLAAEPWDLPEGHCEYWDGEVVAMAGTTKNHHRVARNFSNRLNTAFGDGPCEVFTADIRVRVEPRRKYSNRHEC